MSSLVGHIRTPHEHLEAVRSLLGVRSVVNLPPMETLGLPLASDVVAVEDAPRFDNSQMDGYALAAVHLGGGVFPVGPVIAAGADPAVVAPGGFGDGASVVATGPAASALQATPVIPVMTGAKLPVGTAAVVPVESCSPNCFGVNRVEIPPTPVHQFIRRQGSDIRAGSVLFESGQRINARTVGAAAAQGIAEVPVYEPARVLVCTGGDELGDGGSGDGGGESSGVAMIRDANGPMLTALCAQHGIAVAGHIRTTDDPVAFRALLRAEVQCTTPTAIITSGGISHGQFEVVRQLFASEPGAWFGHVSQQPGGPQGVASFYGVPVVCLPGNPISTAVSFRLFLAPVLGVAPEPTTALLGASVSGHKHKDCFHRAERRTVEGRVVVTPVGGAGSHLLAQSVSADCLLHIAAGTTPSPGDVVPVYPL